MDRGIGGPPAKQLALLIERERSCREIPWAACEPGRGSGRRGRAGGCGRTGRTAAAPSVAAGGSWAAGSGMPRCHATSTVRPILFSCVRDSGTAPGLGRSPARSSMVWSLRGGSRPGGPALGRFSSDSANAGHRRPQRGGDGVDAALRRPAASCSAWSVGSARPRSVKKSSSDRASDPIDRPGRRARSSTACGWFGCSSVSSRPRAGDHRRGPARASTGRRHRRRIRPARPAGRPAVRRGARPARAAGRGCRCQQREHMPRPGVAAQLAADLADSRWVLRRARSGNTTRTIRSRHADRPGFAAPRAVAVGERADRPGDGTSGTKWRLGPRTGCAALGAAPGTQHASPGRGDQHPVPAAVRAGLLGVAASRCRRTQRQQQYSRPMMPTGAPQPRSHVVFPIGLQPLSGFRHIGGIDRPRAPTASSSRPATGRRRRDRLLDRGGVDLEQVVRGAVQGGAQRDQGGQLDLAGLLGQQRRHRRRRHLQPGLLGQQPSQLRRRSTPPVARRPSAAST